MQRGLRNIFPLVALAVVLSAGLILSAGAQTEIGAPRIALSAMSRGGVSLRAETRTLKGEAVLLHLWCIPRGYNEMAKQTLDDDKRTLPVPRENIIKAEVLKPSPFYVDVFTRENGVWTRQQRAAFVQYGDVHEIHTRWLQPKKKIGPIVLLQFGQTHWMYWEVITYPRGIRGKPATQEFLWGGEGEYYYADQSFASVDKNGFLQVEERSRDGEEKPEKLKIYHWNPAKRRYD